MASSFSFGRFSFDVFISFKADDTRRIFIGHLQKALHEKSITTFVDSDDPSEVMEAINDSRVSVVVFSRNYASSNWCMKELVRVMECMRSMRQIVVPVLYENRLPKRRLVHYKNRLPTPNAWFA